VARRITMYLVDTNIWLERLLEQERAEEVKYFLDAFTSDNFFITDFGFHSIGVTLCKLKKKETFLQFVRDSFTDGSVQLLYLQPSESPLVTQTIEMYNLDFDDAYQYTAAEKYDLEIVSFDTDFDKTERGRKTPQQILDSLKQ